MAVYRNQISTVEDINIIEFYRDVMKGLSSSPKYLQSKYFYDAEGDELFQQIMHLPEYYLTKCEEEIFKNKTEEIAEVILDRFDEFDILELGAGDATKSCYLLQCLIDKGKNFTYYPIDISQNVIQNLENELPDRVPGLQVKGLQGDYFNMIRKSYTVSKRRKVVLFLGSNIGNFKPEEAERFLLALNQNLLKGDLLLIGVDLKKSPKQILAAYNDAAGVTKAFNLNLLNRINEELDANFNLSNFDHFPTYDPVSGACSSFLISNKDQKVFIGVEEINFFKHEPIYMELSQKYSESELEDVAADTGFIPVAHFFDNKKWFVDAMWVKK